MSHKKQKKLSKIMKLHYIKLCYRSLLFLLATVFYIFFNDRLRHVKILSESTGKMHWVLNAIWIVYFIEMLLRFLPSSFESMGCQKQFERNYKPTGKPVSEAILLPGIRTFAVLIAWIILNGIFGLLFYYQIFDESIMVLISLAYGVCDMICILFFCPFQTWFMKNRCCCTCRIYNWDFAMMFTPLIFIKSYYSWSLVLLSLGLLAKWEYLVHRHPERFSETTNQFLSCANCEEKLCHHKTQLHSFWKKHKSRLF